MWLSLIRTKPVISYTGKKIYTKDIFQNLFATRRFSFTSDWQLMFRNLKVHSNCAFRKDSEMLFRFVWIFSRSDILYYSINLHFILPVYPNCYWVLKTIFNVSMHVTGDRMCNFNDDGIPKTHLLFGWTDISPYCWWNPHWFWTEDVVEPSPESGYF